MPIEVLVPTLVARNLEEQVKDKLKRRASRNSRSLEAEVRDVLINAPEIEPARPEGIGTEFVAKLAAKLRKAGITREDIDDLNERMAELRRDTRVEAKGIRHRITWP